ncbi:uroporphyrinogen decarboxylase [Candidatus Ishikawella capsulata]|nr:uroporphyrinogen decarboxylase [Candidatus Ishikawaella capsulata]
MYQLKNCRYLHALLRLPVDVTPVWIMRQAGRYLPEYKNIRKKAGGFMSLYKNSDLASEVSLQPLRRYPLDAAIIFSDILTIPDAMGLGLSYQDNSGPYFNYPITCQADVDNLIIPDPEEDIGYVINTVRTTNRALAGEVPLIGFSGSPWTLATYMVEGRSSRVFTKIKKMIYTVPQTLHKMLHKLTQAIILYLNAQIYAGVNAVIIFDTLGGILSDSDYPIFSLFYLNQILDGLLRKINGYRIPITLFTKGGGRWLEKMVDTGCDALGLDYTTNLGEARKRVGSKVALQGNMDPSILYGSPDRIKQEVNNILCDYGQGSGHIFNLGDGIYQDIAPENVGVLIESVHKQSISYHAKCNLHF